MAWNYDMSAAPKGLKKQVSLPNPKAKGFRTIEIRQPVIVSTDKEVLLSFWSKSRNQWSGLADAETAIAWQLMPEPAAGA